MRINRLRLNGFKSFVDPTDLVIMDGLTGVVGPNGCGKSNLLEALRWVMGENRPTAMRGDGMDDVIFAGTATRNSRHFAEVALVIDNSERLAPAGFNDADMLEISRRITRDAGSAYKANGREVRAKDVQMLFADASTGAHSPALVRQGQISELINAKPRSRRRILEEAAGISGLYQRRHEAELRLGAAEANLLRVDDVIEQLAQQLAQLARQARQALRYREIGADLRRTEGLLLYRRWREADSARVTAQNVLNQSARTAAQAEATARQATASRTDAEAALPPLREEAMVAAAVLQRLAVERDTLAAEQARADQVISTLTDRAALLVRDIARETALNSDATDTIDRLNWEADQLAKAQAGYAERIAELAEAARVAATELGECEADLGAATEDAARLAARHQSTERQRVEYEALLRRAQSEAAGAAEAAIAASDAAARADRDFVDARADQEKAQTLVEGADQILADTEAARADAQLAESEARAVRSSAEGEASALDAEVAALGRIVDREAQAGRHLIDHITVEPGYEAALGAALGDDLRAPQVGADVRSGWVLLDDAVDAPLPAGAAPITRHVRAPDVLSRRLSQIGLIDRAAGPQMQRLLSPGQRLVSVEGDLWRWDGFRAATEDVSSTAALRLRQLNRLVILKRDLEDLSARAVGARMAHQTLQKRLADLARADDMARAARRAADQKLTDANRALARAEADKSISEGKREAAELARERFSQEAVAARERLHETMRALADLPDLVAAREELDVRKATVETARLAMMAQRSAHDNARREAEARVRRSQEITKELSGWRLRLETADRRSAELAQRQVETEAELAEAQKIPSILRDRKEKLAEAIATSQSRKSEADDALSRGEAALRLAQEAERSAERNAGEARETRARAQAQSEAAATVLADALARVEEETESIPETLLANLGADPADIPDAAILEAEVVRLRRARDALGAVNLRAEEDADTVQTEHDTLLREKQDLQDAIAKLRAGISGLNREGRERLLTAFEQVNANFTTLFTHLFGGGEARLVLVESDDPLEAGLEILCQPPGKKLSTLSLLSGGEQTLTALALIFGVFLANPAPICVLDEVDAPLDDANVARFCDLLDEMTRRTETRFLIITHHAVTMSRMDRLFGVTMGEQGISQLVSVDLRRAEQLVA